VCPIFTLAYVLTPGEYPPNNIGKLSVVIVETVNTRRGWLQLVHIPQDAYPGTYRKWTDNMTVRNEELGDLEVWIDQDLCTGDGICAQYAPEIFELDIDGLAYVKSAEDELLQDAGATTRVPLPLLNDVADSAKECPGACIHVRRVTDRVEVYGPDAA
jgi:ferredoxin